LLKSEEKMITSSKMRAVAVAITAFALWSGAPVYAADNAIEAPIRTMIAAFNKGDVALAKSTHVNAPMILDEPTAPYAWSGPKAFDDWIAALGKSEKAAGKTGGVVTLGAATRTSVMGQHAYVVVPSTYTFQQAKRTMRETGTMTFGLVKRPQGWKIQAWTWTSPQAVPVTK
jgi:hypothetical protein